MIRYFSTFSGIGGFELGIEKAYNNLGWASGSSNTENGRNKPLSTRGNGNGGRSYSCVGYSEIDKYAIQVYEKHFKGHKNYGDITRINTKSIPGFDLFVGGFPCQSFSIAGKRRGFEDTRGTLFFEIARILKDKRPRYFVLENVKGLLSHDEGSTFKVIITTLDELGYFVEWQVLNSKNFGVPQNRERVFIIGHLGGESRPKVFPIEQVSQTNLRQIGTMKSTYEAGGRIYSTDCAISLSSQGGGMVEKTGMYKIEGRIRRLTPTECERLQGFPDGWTEGVSDTQRYKTLGNAVTVNVIEFIMKKLLRKEI